MLSSLPVPAKHWVAGAFAVLLAVGGIVPSTARAGCGHNVTSRLSRSTQDSFSNLELFRYSAASPFDSAPGDPGRDRPSPCSGPSCSQGRSRPQAPAPSSNTVRSDPCCDTTGALCWAYPESVDKLDNPFTSCPRQSTSPLERPPRGPLPQALS